MKKDIVCDCNVIHKEIVQKLEGTLPKEDFMNTLTEFFKIFADKSRLKILWLLNKNELCVCDITVLLNMTKSAVSHQIKTLRSANLVRSRRQGKEVFYTLSDDHIVQIVETAICHVDHC